MKKTDFYKNKDIVDDILKNGSLDYSLIQNILKYDSDAAIYFYDNNNNPAWFIILKEKGEFQGLDKIEDIGPLERVKAQYLAKMATQKPKEVLDVITSIEARDYYVIQCYFEAILNMPEDELVNSVQAIYKYIDQPLDWWWCGHKAVELMVKLVDKNLDKAFEIASKLTAINKVTEEKKKYSIGEAESKFKGHDYRDFLFKYYSKLWDKDAIRASILLINVFDGYMDSLDNKYDIETGYNHIFENLEKPGNLHSDSIISIIIQAICKAGKVLIERQPDRIKELVDCLQNKKKPIFNRINMYLLRFVPVGVEVDRINLILGMNDSLRHMAESREYWYEYRLLLRDKFEEVSDTVKKQFEDWIKSINIQDSIENWNQWYEKYHKDKNREEFLRQYEARERAKELYLARERYPALFKSILIEAGFEENDAAPRPRMWTPSHEEIHGIPEISANDALWDDPNKAIDMLIDKKEWSFKKKGWGHDSPEEEQSQVFREVLRAKFSGYFAVDPEKISRLPASFLRRYMNCLWDFVRGKEDIAHEWQKILFLGQCLIRDHFADNNYEYIFGDYLRILEEYYNNKTLQESILEINIDKFLSLIQPFVKYKQIPQKTEEDNYSVRSKDGKKPDPFNSSHNRLPGEAIQLLIRAGVIAKNKDKSYYNNNIKTSLIKDLQWAIINIDDYKILCAFCVWLPQLWYLDEVFFDEFVNRLLKMPEQGNEYQKETWGAIWGTYVSWGRTSPTVFRYLKDKGIYTYAIEKINEEDRFDRTQNSPAEGLIEHLMIAYFNGWIGFEDALLVKFFETATVDLRAKAADFFITGFEAVKKGEDEEEKQKVSIIAKKYWEERLKAMSSNAEANYKEALEFTIWIENSLLTPEETFLLLERTLQLTNGRVSEIGDLARFVKSVCNISVNNELNAIRCLNKVTVNEYFATYHSIYKDELSTLMRHIAALDDTYNQVRDIWKEAVIFADNLGRMRIYEYEDIYKQLSGRLSSIKK